MSTDKGTNIKIIKATHTRLKVLSALREKSLQELVDEALISWLDHQEIGTNPDQASELRERMREAQS